MPPFQARQDAAPPEVLATATPSFTVDCTSGGAASSRALPSPHPPRDSLPPSTRFLSDDPIEATRHHLPHWEQSGGTTCFATFRLADSLPAGKLDELRFLRDRWLAAHPSPLSPADTEEYRIRFEETAERWLDAGHGECLLRSPAARRAVEDTLRHFDGTRCIIHAFVVMPNHVHVLFTPAAGIAVGKLLHSWKSFSAKAVNAALHRTGTVWEKESWDRFIRNRRHFDNTLAYIRANPGKLPIPAYVAPSILSWLDSSTPARQDAAPPEVPTTASALSPTSARTSGGAASSRAPVTGTLHPVAPPHASHFPSRIPPSPPFEARQDAAPPEVQATANSSFTVDCTSGGTASSRAFPRSPATPNPRLLP